MATREKHVFKTDMVAHVWAQQSQEDGRNAQNNFYFRGRTIYSYGGHFPIATFVTNKRKERAVLMTTRGYSMTTSGHIQSVRQSLRGLGLPIFNTRDPEPGFTRTRRAEYETRIAELVAKAVRARLNKESYMAHAQHIVREANAYSKFYGLRWQLPIPELTPEQIAKCKAANKAAQAAKALQRKKDAAREAARLAKEEETKRAWVAGAAVQYPYGWGHEPTLLRVYDDKVETSRGAEIPVSHAKRLWPVILKHRAEGTSYQRNGHTIHVGEFSIDRIEPTGDIKAGCHKILWPEIERTAQTLGLL